MKSIFSSAWGVLNQRLKKNISKSDIIKQNLEVGLSFNYRENEYQKSVAMIKMVKRILRLLISVFHININ